MKQGSVLIVGNFELPDLNAAAHRVVNNGKLLRLIGFTPVYLGVRRAAQYYDGVRRLENDTPFEMYEQAYPLTSAQWAAQMFSVGNIVSAAANCPDLTAVMLYNVQFSTLLAVKRAFAGTDVRVLYDCTEWNGYTEGSTLKRAVKTVDSRLIERRLDGNCHGILAVSEKIAAQYRKTPVLRLPPLVDTEDAIWRQPVAPRDRFEFCYAGSPSDKERLDVVIEAFRQLPAGSASLRLIGLSAEDFLAFYPSLRRSVAGEDVLFTGRLSHRETVRAILSCGCFVFIREESRRNAAGFPTKFAEAFTCGVPVITTAVSDVPAYADERCRVLSGVCVQEIAHAMRSVMTDEPQTRRLRTAFDYRTYEPSFRAWIEKIV